MLFRSDELALKFSLNASRALSDDDVHALGDAVRALATSASPLVLPMVLPHLPLPLPPGR